MNNERFLVFDIDDTLYSQMEPLLTACEFSLGRKLKPFMNPGFTELKIL